MHFEAHPTRRYQWPLVLGILAMLMVTVLIAVYGAAYIGTRVTHVLAAASAALAVYFLLLMLYRHFAWRYLIDDHSIESYHGILARRVHSIRIQDLRNINVIQSVMQRLLGVGDIEFSSSAGGEIEVVFFGVARPMHIKELVQRLQRNVPAVRETQPV